LTSNPSPRRRSLWRWAIGVVLVSALALFLARRPILEAIPRTLAAADPEEPGDAIVVLAGDQGERVEHAVELWKRGFARSGVFLVSGGPVYATTTWAELMAAHAVSLGVAREKILIQGRSRTTTEDATESLALLRARDDVRTIVLVTSAWHSRRAKAEFVNASGDRFRVVSCPCAPPVLATDWWHDAPATRAIVTEVLKYLW
jgi:uncharacterized SAM-binding protein YcdF (DUF218 family)